VEIRLKTNLGCKHFGYNAKMEGSANLIRIYRIVQRSEKMKITVGRYQVATHNKNKRYMGCYPYYYSKIKIGG